MSISCLGGSLVSTNSAKFPFGFDILTFNSGNCSEDAICVSRGGRTNLWAIVRDWELFRTLVITYPPDTKKQSRTEKKDILRRNNELRGKYMYFFLANRTIQAPLSPFVFETFMKLDLEIAGCNQTEVVEIDKH